MDLIEPLPGTEDFKLADINNDGETDIVAPTLAGVIWWNGFDSSEPGSPPRRHKIDLGADSRKIDVADLDGDGNFDIVSADGSGQTVWNENLGRAYSEPPE